jgi:hypothetical protein
MSSTQKFIFPQPNQALRIETNIGSIFHMLNINFPYIN